MVRNPEADHLIAGAFSEKVQQYVERSLRPKVQIAISSGFPIDINLHGLNHKDNSLYRDSPHKGNRLLYPHLDEITVERDGEDVSDRFGSVIIRGARILRVVINESFRGVLRFEDCWISSLHIKERNPSVAWTRISLERCYVGGLNLGSNSCIEFSMRNGGIKELVCPPSDKPSPVSHVFSVDNSVILHQSPTHVDEANIVNYRNLLIHTKNRASPLTQQVISAAIFRLEMKGDSGFLKLANFCYGIFSAYNTRPGRPLVWMLSSLALCFYLSYKFDLAAVVADCTKFINNGGWVSEICDAGETGKAHRSFSLVLNALMNPFSAFSSKSVVEAKSLYFSVFLVFAGLMNLVWAALTIFSVKTRFSSKTSGSSSN